MTGKKRNHGCLRTMRKKGMEKLRHLNRGRGNHENSQSVRKRFSVKPYLFDDKGNHCLVLLKKKRKERDEKPGHFATVGMVVPEKRAKCEG